MFPLGSHWICLDVPEERGPGWVDPRSCLCYTPLQGNCLSPLIWSRVGARHILCGALQQAPNVSREANSKSLSDPIHYVGPETLVWVGSQPPFPFLPPEWCSHLPPLLGKECRHGGGGRRVFSWWRSSVYLYSHGRLTGTRVIVYADVTLATPAPTQIHESTSGRASN